MLRVLRGVAARGDAQLITAGKSDVPWAILAARATYRRLLQRGVRIAEYVKRPLHAKLIVADDAVYIGSGNFDIRSLHINLELMLRVDDAAFAGEARALFERDLADSRPVEAAAFAKEASWWNRTRWGAAYTLFTSIDLLLVKRFAR
jgi:cardiolipin synthase